MATRSQRRRYVPECGKRRESSGDESVQAASVRAPADRADVAGRRRLRKVRLDPDGASRPRAASERTEARDRWLLRLDPQAWSVTGEVIGGASVQLL